MLHFLSILSSFLLCASVFFTDSTVLERDCVIAIEILTDTVPTESKPVVKDKIEKEEEIFMIVEDSPRFPGCEHLDISKYDKENCAERKLMEYIYGNLRYPEDAVKKSIEGQVIVQYVVGKDGSINDINIVKDIGEGCGEEVARVVENMNNLPNRWKSGKQRGRRVRVKYTLPVKFSLTD